MKKETAFIIIDTGFSEGVLQSAPRIIGFYDLVNRRVVMHDRREGGLAVPDCKPIARDPGHGSMVLANLLRLKPDAPIVLIRSHDDDGNLMQTSFQGGIQVADGWTEAYLWAVALCKMRGFNSVANCSFGRFMHAMDGTGWVQHQLSRVTGAGKPGHILVAAAGAGDGRAVHACWLTAGGGMTVVDCAQTGDTTFNFWTDDRDGWTLEVARDGRIEQRHDGNSLPVNFWNNRKQLTFTVPGSGWIQLVTRCSGSGEQRFDCWARGDGARFRSHVDANGIVEPAILPAVLAVGFRHGAYADDQRDPGAKPDVLIEGKGMISFNLPRVDAVVADMLSESPGLDLPAVCERLGKFPVLPD